MFFDEFDFDQNAARLRFLQDRQQFIEKLQKQLDSGAPLEYLTEESPLLNWHLYNDAHLLQRVLERKPNLEVETEYGRTPLMRAAGDKAAEAVLLLLKAGANANHKSLHRYMGGCTPLSSAIQEGQLEIVHALLNFGANPNTSATYGFRELPPLMHVCNEGISSIELTKNRAKIIQLLLAYGADPDKKSDEGQSALEYAKIRYGHFAKSPYNNAQDQVRSLQKVGQLLVRYQTMKRLLSGIRVSEQARLPQDVVKYILKDIF
jgi:hypothetical protein